MHVAVRPVTALLNYCWQWFLVLLIKMCSQCDLVCLLTSCVQVFSTDTRCRKFHTGKSSMGLQKDSMLAQTLD